MGHGKLVIWVPKTTIRPWFSGIPGPQNHRAPNQRRHRGHQTFQYPKHLHKLYIDTTYVRENKYTLQNSRIFVKDLSKPPNFSKKLEILGDTRLSSGLRYGLLICNLFTYDKQYGYLRWLQLTWIKYAKHHENLPCIPWYRDAFHNTWLNAPSWWFQPIWTNII